MHFETALTHLKEKTINVHPKMKIIKDQEHLLHQTIMYNMKYYGIH